MNDFEKLKQISADMKKMEKELKDCQKSLKNIDKKFKKIITNLRNHFGKMRLILSMPNM